MSSPSIPRNVLDRRRFPVDRSALSQPLRAAGFWSAIALPFLHAPLLLSGLDTGPEIVAFLTLLALNALALVVGQGHDPT